MAVTRLERKGRKNKSVAKRKTANIKRLSAAPVIKKVDVNQIKAEFRSQKANPGSAATAGVSQVEEGQVINSAILSSGGG